MRISQSTVDWLRSQGHQAVHLREEGLQRIKDGEIVEKARREDRVILTCDLDFGDIMAASGDTCPSVVIFRLDNERPENVNGRLAQALRESSEAVAKGAIIALEETRHRVRLLPIPGKNDN